MDVKVERSIPGAISEVDRISISPSGSAAFVYSSASRRAQILTGLPDEPVVAQDFDLAVFAGIIGVTAVNDAGDTALVAVGDEASAVLYAMRASTAPAVIYRAKSLAGLVFLRGSNDALLTDPGESQAIWVKDVSGAASATLLADKRSGLTAPAAIAASEDGTQAFVTNAGAILSVPLSGAAITTFKCSCTPTRLQRMHGRDVFLLTDSVQVPLAVFDGSVDASHILFIPVNLPRLSRTEETK